MMKKFQSYINRYATLRNALIVFVVFEIVIQVLHRFDMPLIALTPGVSKLDFHNQYDVSTVRSMFDAYGQQGRVIYAWDLAIDSLFPVLLGLSAILFAFVVIRHPFWQGLLILTPLVFTLADLIENAFFLSFILSYPSLSPGLVSVANVFTRIKLFTIYFTWLQLVLFLFLAIILAMVSLVRSKLAAKKTVA